MKIKEYIQILMLSLVVIGTTLDVLYVNSDISIEVKVDFEKENESSEKEKQEKTDSKYIESLKKVVFQSDEKLASNFSTKLIINHTYVDNELIPPEV